MWKLSSHTVIEYWLNISCVYTFHVLHDVLLLKDSSMCGMSQLKTALVCQIMFWVVICIIIVLSSRLLRPVQPSNNYSIELPHKLSKTVHCLWNIADKTAALFRNCPATHTHTLNIFFWSTHSDYLEIHCCQFQQDIWIIHMLIITNKWQRIKHVIVICTQWRTYVVELLNEEDSSLLVYTCQGGCPAKVQLVVCHTCIKQYCHGILHGSCEN